MKGLEEASVKIAVCCCSRKGLNTHSKPPTYDFQSILIVPRSSSRHSTVGRTVSHLNRSFIMDQSRRNRAGRRLFKIRTQSLSCRSQRKPIKRRRIFRLTICDNGIKQIVDRHNGKLSSNRSGWMDS